jgi:hypothetical protein
MKILVTAKALDLDRTSEGICTTKFLYSLLNAGMEVICLAPSAAITPGKLRLHGSWINEINIVPIDGRKQVDTSARSNPHPKSEQSNGSPGLAERKSGVLVAYCTGFSPKIWSEVRLWKKAIQCMFDKHRPDLVFVRAAGDGFEPHLAMAGLTSPVPWIANYHDPFPISKYPEPYRRRFFLMSLLQEKWNARIMRAASAVSFPSDRLLRWMLRDDLGRLREKGVIIPHIAGEVPLSQQEPRSPELATYHNRFTLIHAGTLLGPRQPWGLVDAFRRFVAKEPARAKVAELVFVGKVNRCHKSDPRWLEMTQSPGIRVVENRVSYAESLDLLSKASVAVVLEAEAAESPFFPAKLMDYMLQGKPILALSPVKSVVSDILGATYPYRALPSETKRIEEFIESLWTLWQKGDLAQAATPRQLAGQFSVEAVGESCKTIFARCLDVRERFSKRQLPPQ